jgi:hypothetical protein
VNAAYAEILLPRRHTLLGWRLGELTLGHLALFQRLKSPLPPLPCDADGAPARGVGPYDLALGLWASRRPHDAAWRAIQRNGPIFRAQIRFLGWMFRGDAFEAALIQWIAYATDSCTRPATWTKEGEKTARAPFILGLHLRMFSEFGMSPDAALRVPVRQALWWTLALGEQKGSCEWESPEEREAKKAAFEHWRKQQEGIPA